MGLLALDEGPVGSRVGPGVALADVRVIVEDSELELELELDDNINTKKNNYSSIINMEPYCPYQR